MEIVNNDKKRFSFSGEFSKGNQRRKHARIPVEINASFTYIDANNQFTDKCLITSLSTGGLGIEANAVLLKGDIITVIFALDGNIIKEDLQITRTHGKDVGGKFIGPNKKNVEIIQDYIYGKIFK